MKPPELMDNSRSLIGWMTHNRVTPNLMMIVFIAGGFFFASQMQDDRVLLQVVPVQCLRPHISELEYTLFCFVVNSKFTGHYFFLGASKILRMPRIACIQG